MRRTSSLRRPRPPRLGTRSQIRGGAYFRSVGYLLLEGGDTLAELDKGRGATCLAGKRRVPNSSPPTIMELVGERHWREGFTVRVQKVELSKQELLRNRCLLKLSCAAILPENFLILFLLILSSSR